MNKKVIVLIGLILLIGFIIVTPFMINNNTDETKENQCGVPMDEWLSLTIPVQRNTCERLGGTYMIINFYEELIDAPVITGFCVKEVEAIK